MTQTSQGLPLGDERANRTYRPLTPIWTVDMLTTIPGLIQPPPDRVPIMSTTASLVPTVINSFPRTRLPMAPAPRRERRHILLGQNPQRYMVLGHRHEQNTISRSETATATATAIVTVTVARNVTITCKIERLPQGTALRVLKMIARGAE